MKITRILTIIISFLLLTNFSYAEKYPEICPILNRTLKVGDSGNDVRRMQVVLGQEGIAYLNGTGYFGPVTLSAVKIFQMRNNIYPVG